MIHGVYFAPTISEWVDRIGLDTRDFICGFGPRYTPRIKGNRGWVDRGSTTESLNFMRKILLLLGVATHRSALVCAGWWMMNDVWYHWRYSWAIQSVYPPPLSATETGLPPPNDTQWNMLIPNNWDTILFGGK